MDYLEMENQIARWFHLTQQAAFGQGKLQGEMELSIPASPAYRLSKDRRTGAVSLDTFTYRFYREKGTGAMACRVVMKRAEAKFTRQGNGAVMTSLRWDTIQEMEPFFYEGKEWKGVSGNYPSLPGPGRLKAEDRLEIRSMQNMFFERRFHQAEKLLSGEPDAELSIPYLGITGLSGKTAILQELKKHLERESRNNHCYLFLGITGFPVMEGAEADGEEAAAEESPYAAKDPCGASGFAAEGCGRAKGMFLAEVFQVYAGIGGEKMGQWKLKRHLSVVRADYRKEKGRWKIHKMRMEHIVSLPEQVYRNDIRFDKMGQSQEPWRVDSQGFEVCRDPEAAQEAENIISKWVYSCRRGELMEFLKTYMKNPLNENYMLIRSQGDKTKALESLEEVTAKLQDLTDNYHNPYYTYHAPTTPVILVNARKDRIRGIWFDHAATSLYSMAKGPEAVPYMVFVNKYVHEFRKIEGKWYLVRFFCEPLISQPDWLLNMTENMGYIMKKDTVCFPAQFEE